MLIIHVSDVFPNTKKNGFRLRPVFLKLGVRWEDGKPPVPCH